MRLDEADDDDKDEGCTLIVALYQKGTRTGRSLGKKPLTIGFAIYEASSKYNLILFPKGAILMREGPKEQKTRERKTENKISGKSKFKKKLLPFT